MGITQQAVTLTSAQALILVLIMLAYSTAIYPNNWRIKLQQNVPIDLSFPLQFVC